MKRILKKILYPNRFIGIPLCIFSAILLIYVFSAHLEGYFISYVAYLLSSYSLILFMIWFCKACKFSSDFIKETKIYEFYDRNSHFILKMSLIISAIVNLVYGLFELIIGTYYKSWWFITLAIYYLFLWLMKILLVKDFHNIGKNINKEYSKLKNTGVTLFLLNIVLIGMIILIITKDQYLSYPGHLIYGIAFYDFYLIITAMINVFKYKYDVSPIVSASKCISLTVAMISMLSLEVAMISQFGDNDANFKLVMTSCTGFAIAFINSIMSIIMIYRGNKKTGIT